MEQNYYCNGEWFESYQAARVYSDILLKMTGAYNVVYTKAEKDSIINAIDHELECGK